ncbi:hypothetical protein LCGC14_0823790 [marine sediment metagenome]|uniref:ParB-like N-terminal domain-containing protein n=1 Tax=marine sediment metagenome TaxID=412755 RepID=A0A0F9S2W8_9ZZZZ
MKKTLSEVVKKVDMILIEGPERDQRLEIDQDAIKELAQSIEEVGLMQPILLAPRDNKYEVVWGNRRFMAHKYLGRSTILAKIQELSLSQIVIMRATENLFREGITPIEEAMIYQSLIEIEEMSIDQIAVRMRKSAGIVRRRLDLLRMPECLQKAIQKKEIKYGVAENLWQLGDVSRMEYYLQFAIENGATNAVVRGWVKDELDTMRRQRSDVEEGGERIAVNEAMPIYTACQICREAMEIGKETIIRACPVCLKAIIEKVKKE